ncbi:MAG: tetratricopeptide repeat protein [Lachnospiraceae bacterium]|nr:tetratricopeptide repeat protein [Lachnospiraceae bacterium]
MNTRKRTGLCCLLVTAFLFSGCSINTGTTIQEEKEAGIAAMEKQDYEEAIKHFDKSVEMAGGKVNEQVVDTCFYKAAAQYNLGKIDEAVKQYTAIMKYDENDPRPCFLRGSVYLKEGKLKKALADYKEAIVRDESDYDMYILIYRNLAAQGYREEGETYLQQALDIKGKSKENYLGRGRVYLEMKDYDNASKQLENLKDKSSDEALALLGDIAMESGDYDKALKYYQKGLQQKNPTDRQKLLRGEIAALEYTGNFAEAKEKMTAYLKLYPSDVGALQEQIFLNTR